MKKLVCDKCGYEITEIEEVELALEGQEAWEASRRAEGCEPRGVFPCKYHLHCGGEMKLVKQHRKLF